MQNAAVAINAVAAYSFGRILSSRAAIYPLDEDDFKENLKHEATENIRRLRHRARLALWCGNNEMEWGWESWGWSRPDYEDDLNALAEKVASVREALWELKAKPLTDWLELKQAYNDFFHTALPAWVARLDPDTDYWPSSPSSNTPFTDVNGQEMGDAHYWDVWHGRKPFTAYRAAYQRFKSEFGFQALPAIETVKHFTDESDRNLDGLGSGEAPTAGAGRSSGEQAVTVGAYSVDAVSDPYFSRIVSDDNEREVVLVTELWDGVSLTARSVTSFVPPKHLMLVDPRLSASGQEEGDELVINVTSQSLASFVELSLVGEDAEFSDNYFSSPRGQNRSGHLPAPDWLDVVAG